jgi:hypothetical protein
MLSFSLSAPLDIGVDGSENLDDALEEQLEASEENAQFPAPPMP